jgi:magnesium transporter
MLRLNYQIPGTPPATLLARSETIGRPPKITLFIYDQEHLEELEISSISILKEKLDPSRVNWVNINGFGDGTFMQQLGEIFGLHPLALEDVLNTTQRPKLEQYEDHLFIVSELVYFDTERRLSAEQLSLFLGANFVVSIQEETGEDWFEPIRNRLRTGRGFARKMHADYLVYAILDAVVDHLFPLLEVIGDQLEESEEELLGKPSRDTLHNLYHVQRLLLQLRRAAWPHREIFNSLLRDESGLVHSETRLFLRDCYDHSTQIIDMVETYRDLGAGLMDVHFASIDSRTNEIVRVLTVVSVFFLPLTFLAGVYGMNFNTEDKWNMPELSWPFGYVYFWGVCFIITSFMLVFFKRKRWI